MLHIRVAPPRKFKNPKMVQQISRNLRTVIKEVSVAQLLDAILLDRGEVPIFFKYLNACSFYTRLQPKCCDNGLNIVAIINSVKNIDFSKNVYANSL